MRHDERLGGGRHLLCRIGRLTVRLPGSRCRGRRGEQFVEIEAIRLHVEPTRKTVAAQQIADVVGQLAVGFHVAASDRQPELPEGQRRRRDGRRGTADLHVGKLRERETQLLDDKRTLGPEFVVAVLLDVGHAARKF